MRAALETLWSNGQVNRLKTASGGLYGRGASVLLRARVLHRVEPPLQSSPKAGETRCYPASVMEKLTSCVRARHIITVRATVLHRELAATLPTEFSPLLHGVYRWID